MAWNITPAKEEIALLMEAGFICRDAGRYAQARDIFRGVRAMAPASEVVEVALGTVCFHEADFPAAAKHYQRAMELNPASGLTHAHAGELALFQMDKEAALVHLRKALELEPRGDVNRMARSLIELAGEVRFAA